MKYMLMLAHPEEAAPAPDSPEGQAEFAAWMRFTQELAESGQLVASDPLQPRATATTVRVRDGQQLLSDGPFAETKETVSGYYVVDVDDLDAALAWAARIPNVHYGSVEVRPIREVARG